MLLLTVVLIYDTSLAECMLKTTINTTTVN